MVSLSCTWLLIRMRAVLLAWILISSRHARGWSTLNVSTQMFDIFWCFEIVQLRWHFFVLYRIRPCACECFFMYPLSYHVEVSKTTGCFNIQTVCLFGVPARRKFCLHVFCFCAWKGRGSPGRSFSEPYWKQRKRILRQLHDSPTVKIAAICSMK